ncbi:glucans biosynthesis glucosyltransferase MdoH [Amorphus orientalis]|uniref:Glucans biosynthesis glucosyltransferase H n=1 Tax=Amorphus orientalis TaxID=649198 RepID=A0AAE4ATC3_9HYPH|nr:glucans biosynthesis glucosyltransferase MdoH [Amorphus orientalis]MDQ0315990.1 membrane glycosyltransferase [Amorphus orientalis]
MSSAPSHVHAMSTGATPGVKRRRLIFATLTTVTALALLALMTVTLSPNGYDAADLVMIGFFAVTLPYTAVGFWNAVIGLVLMRFSRAPLELTCPAAASDDPSRAISDRTALLSCIRNEDVETVSRNLSAMIDGLAHAGVADRFDVFVLSDSNWLDVIEAEETTIAALQARWADTIRITYRRRDDNPGYKAGNIRDFCDRWGADYQYALVLDADSFMSAAAIQRLVRVMENSPEIGILQSLVVGSPTTSFFARVFQFGMRLGMRSHTMGAAWWQADCGPYWGHNAIIRLAPFMADCHLPTLPGRPPLGGWILSHDQVEAVLMRRAGYEVRVIPEEFESYEENPPTLLEFIRRDLRWCQGNMQYGRLLGMKGLAPVSRIQLALAMLMFLGSAAWIGFMATTAARVFLADEPAVMFRPDTGMAMLATILTMIFAPKLATVIDVLSRREARRAFGGTFRILVSVMGEVLFFMLLAPTAALAHTLFIAGLPFGRTIGWSAQRRSGHSVSPFIALRRFWAQTALGVAGIVGFAGISTAALIAAAPVVGGLTLAVPFAVITASATLGALAVRFGLWRIPEETLRPAALAPLSLPALQTPWVAGAGETPISAVSEPAKG